MAKLYVSEYPGLALTDQADSVPLLACPPSVEYSIIVSAGSSGPPQPLQATTKFVELSCDTTCSYVIASFVGSVAALSNCRLNANERVIRRVPFNFEGNINRGGVYPVLSTAYGVFTTANV